METVGKVEPVAARKAQIDMEEFIFAKAGLNKGDLDTIALQINGHFFRLSITSFVAFIQLMSHNAESFLTLISDFNNSRGDKALN